MNQDRKNMLILLIGFIISRVMFYQIAPFRFNTLFFYMQYLDPDILRHDLWNGLWHLHAQPPLFNLFLGLVLKLSPSGLEARVFAALYSGMGIVIMLAGYVLMRYLRISKRIALAVSMLFMLFPPVIQGERWLFYSYPLAMVLLLSAIFLYWFMDSKKITYLTLFLTAVATIVLSRSFFHVIFWMLPIVIMTLFMAVFRADQLQRRRFWLYLGISIFFLLISSSIYIKNYLQYGLFTSSTWQGMNLAGMTGFVNHVDIEKLISSGEVTPLARIPRFSPPDVYYNYYGYSGMPQSQPEIRELDEAIKPSGAINGNNRIYAKASKEYQQNTLTILRHYPLSYLKAIINEVYIFFGFAPYRFFWNYSEWGSIQKDTLLHIATDIGLLYAIPFFLACIFIMGGWTMTAELRRQYKQHIQDEQHGQHDQDSHQNNQTGRGNKATTVDQGALAGKSAPLPVYAYILFNLIYVFAVANMIEFGEGCYMRMPVDPFLAIGLALALDRIIHRDRLRSTRL
jgi:hypothetical protein